ncbi:hypothetical protein CSAL01_02498 [Colletotrichum salicis]|uniref:Uncharacterized protein n=1 Tax=Colletotrichum salicis TaxID=1209931 RepID=A0A135UHP7_9PEZI|nr:hypothetical protein CSAL01_02498 [Colletotrichum salicis]
MRATTPDPHGDSIYTTQYGQSNREAIDGSVTKWHIPLQEEGIILRGNGPTRCSIGHLHQGQKSHASPDRLDAISNERAAAEWGRGDGEEVRVVKKLGLPRLQEMLSNAWP